MPTHRLHPFTVCTVSEEKRASEEEGDHAAGHQFLVLLPEFAILGGAAGVVPEGSVGQQKRKVEDVEIGQRPAEEGWAGPEKRGHDLREIVEVAGQTPPACGVSQMRAFGLGVCSFWGFGGD